MTTNSLYREARELTYSDFLFKWVWQNKDKEWTLKKKERCVGRIFYSHPTSGERFYL
jgi:hypothetical protein